VRLLSALWQEAFVCVASANSQPRLTSRHLGQERELRDGVGWHATSIIWLHSILRIVTHEHLAGLDVIVEKASHVTLGLDSVPGTDCHANQGTEARARKQGHSMGEVAKRSATEQHGFDQVPLR